MEAANYPETNNRKEADPFDRIGLMCIERPKQLRSLLGHRRQIPLSVRELLHIHQARRLLREGP